MKENNSKRTLILVLLVLVAALTVPVTVRASASAATSSSDVYWSWGEQAPGTSQVVRTANGASANLQVGGLRAGNAATGWWIVFNHPELCVPEPYDCGPDDMFGNPAAGGDFLLLSGNVIGRSGMATFAGHLQKDSNRGSGLAEILCPETMDCTVGLTNPEGALIILATHDHGPQQTGEVLVDQISSFLGGCEVFVGDAFGFATGTGDIPDTEGECSTIQVSPHMP